MVVRRIGCAIHRSMKDKQQVLAFVTACKLRGGEARVEPDISCDRTKLAAFLDKWIGRVAYYDTYTKKWLPLRDDVNDMRVSMLTELMEVAGMKKGQIDSLIQANLSNLDEVDLAMSS